MQLQEASRELTALIRLESVHSILERKGRRVWSISPSATVFDAIALMDEAHVGALMVLSEGELVGIISERDYARKVFLKGRSSKETLVREVMSAQVIAVRSDYALDQCLRIMTEQRVRHLPVLEGTRVVGVISIGDLVNAIISAQAETVHQMSYYISGRYPG